MRCVVIAKKPFELGVLSILFLFFSLFCVSNASRFQCTFRCEISKKCILILGRSVHIRIWQWEISAFESSDRSDVRSALVMHSSRTRSGVGLQ